MKLSWTSSGALAVSCFCALACAAGIEDSDGATSGSTSGGATSSSGASTGAGTSTSGEPAGSSTSTSDATGGATTAATGTTGDTSGSSTLPPTSTTMGGGGFCGDGVLEAPAEECDDGNSVDGDGCNKDCQVSGKLIWSDLFNGDADQNDEALAVAVDAEVAIYLAGAAHMGVDGRDIWVRKYNPDTTVAWDAHTPGGLGGTDLARGVAVAADGSVYAAGYIRMTDGQAADIWLRKYDASGAELWTRTHHDGVGAGDDAGFDVAVDSQQNVAVSAHSRTASLSADMWLRKYDSEGTTLWTRTHNGAAGKGDHGRGVAIDGGDNLYVGGTEAGADSQLKAWLRKYDTDGNELWTRTWGPDNTWARIESVAARPDGAVYVAGYQNPGGVKEIVARSYDKDGGLRWTYTSLGASELGAEARGVAVDLEDRVLVVGFEVTETGNQLLVTKLDGVDGSLMWEYRLQNASDPNDVAFDVTTTDALEVIVAGRYKSVGTSNDIWIGRFTP